MAREVIEIRYDSRGLVPAVVQDFATGQVLMVAWMNEEALQRTVETGEAHFWSRSRQELWRKGATSGYSMRVCDILVDCDADTLLVKVDPAGPACHTGEQSCFYRNWVSRSNAAESGGPGVDDRPSPPASQPPGDVGIVRELFDVILDRKTNRPYGSYTAQLLAGGEDEVLKKVGEEAVEVVLAAKGQGDERLLSEIADLTYHLLVLLAARGLEPADVQNELAKRRGRRTRDD